MCSSIHNPFRLVYYILFNSLFIKDLQRFTKVNLKLLKITAKIAVLLKSSLGSGGYIEKEKKCNLTLAMSPTCHSNNALLIC